MSYLHAVDYHSDRRTIFGYKTRLWRQRPAEVDIVGSRNSAALRRCIDCAEGLRRMCVVHRNRPCSKIERHAHVVECTGMDLVSAITGCAHAAGIRQEVSEHLITPTRTVIIGMGREHSCHVWSCIGYENGCTDEYQITRTSAFACDRFTENIDVRNFSLVQRPPGNWDRAHNATDSIGRRIKTTERQDGRCAVDIHLNILPRI